MTSTDPERTTSKKHQLLQRGLHMFAQRPKGDPAPDTPAEDLWYVACYGKRTSDWKGLLKVNHFRWAPMRRCWFLDRVTEEHAEWMAAFLEAINYGAFRVLLRRGIFVEPATPRRFFRRRKAPGLE